MIHELLPTIRKPASSEFEVFWRSYQHSEILQILHNAPLSSCNIQDHPCQRTRNFVFASGVAERHEAVPMISLKLEGERLDPKLRQAIVYSGCVLKGLYSSDSTIEVAAHIPCLSLALTDAQGQPVPFLPEPFWANRRRMKTDGGAQMKLYP